MKYFIGVILFLIFSYVRAESEPYYQYRLIEPLQFATFEKLKTLKKFPFSRLNHFLDAYQRWGSRNNAFSSTMGTVNLAHVTFLGYFFLGFQELSESLMTLYLAEKNRFNANQMISEFHLAPIYPFVGEDGVKLFALFLQAPQKVLYRGKIHTIRTILTKGHINEKITPLFMREITDQFIRYYQKKKISLNPDYKKIEFGQDYYQTLNLFLEGLGHVVWSKKSLLNNKFSEQDLYSFFYKKRILSFNGQLNKRKNFFSREKINSYTLMRILKKEGINDKKIINSIVHDLGFITPDDLNIEEWGPLPLFLSPQISSYCLKSKKNIEINLQQILKKFYSNYSSFQNDLKISLLHSLVDEERLKSYLKKEGLNSNDLQYESQNILYKIVVVNSLKKDYDLHQLEKDLDVLTQWVIENLYLENIHNTHLQLAHFPRELVPIALSLLTEGFSYSVAGISSIILNWFPTGLPLELIGDINFLGNLALAIAGVPLLSIHGFQTAVTFYQGIYKYPHKMKIDQKIHYLLLKHLQERPIQVDSFLKDQLTMQQELNLILMEQKNRLILNKLGIESLRVIGGIVNMTLGIGSILMMTSVIPVSLALFPAISGISLAVALPIYILVDREKNLLKMYQNFKEASQFYHGLLVRKWNGLSNERENRLLYFLKSNPIMLMKIKAREVELNQNIVSLYDSDNISDIREILPHLRQSRRSLLNYFKNSFPDRLATTYCSEIDRTLYFLFHDQIPDRNYLQRLTTKSDVGSIIWIEDHLDELFATTWPIINLLLKNRKEMNLYLYSKKIKDAMQIEDKNCCELKRLKKNLLNHMSSAHSIFRTLRYDFHTHQLALNELYPQSCQDPYRPWGDSLLSEIENFLEDENKMITQLDGIQKQDIKDIIIKDNHSLGNLLHLYFPSIQPQERVIDGQMVAEHKKPKRPHLLLYLREFKHSINRL